MITARPTWLNCSLLWVPRPTCAGVSRPRATTDPAGRRPAASAENPPRPGGLLQALVDSNLQAATASFSVSSAGFCSFFSFSSHWSTSSKVLSRSLANRPRERLMSDGTSESGSFFCFSSALQHFSCVGQVSRSCRLDRSLAIEFVVAHRNGNDGTHAFEHLAARWP